MQLADKCKNPHKLWDLSWLLSSLLVAMVNMYTNRAKWPPSQTFSVCQLTLSMFYICIANCPQDVVCHANSVNDSVPLWSTASVAIHMATRNPNASRWSPRLSLTPRLAKLMLMLVASDVHPNPGLIQPRKRNRRRRPSYPDCPRAECPKKVGYDEPVIRCDTCDKWWHARCGGLSDTQYTALEADESSTWHCPSSPQLHRNDAAAKVPPIRLKKVKGKWRVNNAPPRPTMLMRRRSKRSGLLGNPSDILTPSKLW